MKREKGEVIVSTAVYMLIGFAIALFTVSTHHADIEKQLDTAKVECKQSVEEVVAEK